MAENNNEVKLTPPQDSLFERISTGLSRKLHFGGTLFIVAMMGLTVVNVVGRYGLDKPVPGVMDLSCFMLIILIFLTMPYTMMTKNHIVVGLVVDRFSERTQAIIGSITYTLCLAFTLLLVWQSFVRGVFMMQAGQISIVTGLPLYPFIYLIGVGWALFGLVLVNDLIHFVQKVAKK